jgi:hypothetical protein
VTACSGSYTLKSQKPRGNNWKIDDINLNVNTSDGLDRRIFFHDPDYFIISFNPVTKKPALPLTVQTIQSSTSGRFYYSVALTEHEKLSTPHDPCVEEPTYSFQGCIKESLSKKAGCRMHWDTISDQARPVCTTLAQYEPLSSVPSPAYLTLDVWMITTDITVKTDQLIISPASLVANIGGTLSLFLGISFMTLWDGITQLGNICKQAKGYAGF